MELQLFMLMPESWLCSLEAKRRILLQRLIYLGIKPELLESDVKTIVIVQS